MFGSNCTGPEVQFGGSVCAIGTAGIGHSPPTVSDWVLERYGQNVTESESMIPDGQFASASGVPFTGFSGIGGVTVPPGPPRSRPTPGPGAGVRIALQGSPARMP